MGNITHLRAKTSEQESMGPGTLSRSLWSTTMGREYMRRLLSPTTVFIIVEYERGKVTGKHDIVVESCQSKETVKVLI